VILLNPALLLQDPNKRLLLFISFPNARKAVLSEQTAKTSSKRTAASVVSPATTNPAR